MCGDSVIEPFFWTFQKELKKVNIVSIFKMAEKRTIKNYLSEPALLICDEMYEIFVQWRNWGFALSVIATLSRKKLSFLKDNQNKVVIFVFLHFKFCRTIEKCYYVSILLKTSIGAALFITNCSKKTIFPSRCKSR